MSTWVVDPSHTLIQFSVRHLMISKVRGEFTSFAVNVQLDEDKPELAAVHAEIDTASINTRDANRDGHLRSPDFFNSEAFPKMVFDSTSVVRAGENNAVLKGNLTIRDVTHPVELQVEHTGIAKAPWGVVSAGFNASTRINRKDWGLTWNQGLETGGVLVGDDVEIHIEIELIKQEQPAAAAAA